jgi:hypothetical protein
LAKIERALTALRAASRDTTGQLEIALERIGELEAKLAQLATEMAVATAVEIDPGDAVPPGVAVEELAPRR